MKYNFFKFHENRLIIDGEINKKNVRYWLNVAQGIGRAYPWASGSDQVIG